MNNTSPVIFTAFANPHRDLAELNQEELGIQKALRSLVAKSKIRHTSHHSVDVNTYFDILQDWQEQVILFHFGGHANGQGLRFTDTQTFIEPLAKEITERNPQVLQIVFLNGCATYHLTELFLKLGVRAVIATRNKVGDNLAAKFAIQFYHFFAKGDSLDRAYKSALNNITAKQAKKSSYRLEAIGRGEMKMEFSNLDNDDEFPWGLYIADAEILDTKLIQEEGKNPITPTPIAPIDDKSILISRNLLLKGGISIIILFTLAFIIDRFALRTTTFSYKVGIKGIPKHLLKNIQISLRNQRKPLNDVGLSNFTLDTKLLNTKTHIQADSIAGYQRISADSLYTLDKESIVFLRYNKLIDDNPFRKPDSTILIYIPPRSPPTKNKDSSAIKTDSIKKTLIPKPVEFDSVSYSLGSVKNRLSEFTLYVIDKRDTSKIIEQIYPDPETGRGKIFFPKKSKYLLKTILNNKLCNIRELQPNDTITIPGGHCKQQK